MGTALALVLWGVAVISIVLRLNWIKAGCQRRDAHLESLYDALRERQELTLELVNSCSGRLPDEADLVEAVALSRCHAMQARTVLAKTKTETDLCWALARLLAAAEQDHELSGRQSFNDLLLALEAVENRAARATNAYNAEVAALKSAMHKPWTAAVARMAQLDAGFDFALDPRLAREAMMSLIDGHHDAKMPWRGPVASVAFSP